MNLKKLNRKKSPIFTDKLLMMCVVILLMFVVITYQFYKIQIIEHDEYDQELQATVQKTVDIPAIRGLIYDRYGKPLAVNKAVYVLKVDPQVTLAKGQLDQILLNTANLLRANGDQYIDNMPISDKAPFVFTEDEDSVRRFITNYVPYNDNDHKQELYRLSATELINYLKGEDVFNISPNYSDEEVRKIIAMRLEIRQSTYARYKQVTIAEDISMETLATIEEHQDEFASVVAEVESQRFYPYGKAFGNILGYTRTITESQYESLKEQGYEQDDIVGQVGIESTQEAELRGEKGSKQILVDTVGSTVYTVSTEEATAGNDIYLSMDAEMQVEIYNALERCLSEAIVERLKGTNSKAVPLTGHEVLVSMAKNNQIDIKAMSGADVGTMQAQLYEKILTSYQAELTRLEEEEKHLTDEEKTDLTIKQHFADMLDSKPSVITDRELVLTMCEQKTLKVSEDQLAAIKAGNYSVDGLLINLLENGQLKPDQMDVTPSSGSAVVVDPNTGQTLALVSYPSYDNNEFIQNFNSYYRKLHDGVDMRNIEINRALKTAKAPGSTFKMISAIAGLEEGVVTKDTLINDTGIYTNAGTPGPHCWVYDNTGHGHGAINVKTAIEVSCNYFFYDVAYRLGLKYGNPYGGISKLTEYVEMMGLGDKTGIELEEVSPNISSPTNLVNNQALRALNRVRQLKDENKQNLYEELVTYFDKGFYSLGDSHATKLEDKIDYLSAPYIRTAINTDLGISLSESFDSIYDKVLGDFSEEMADGTSEVAGQIAERVMAGDNNLTLKYRTKVALEDYLQTLIQPGTKKSIQKMLSKMPDGLVKNAFLEGYKETLTKYQGQEGMAEVCSELQNRITAIEKGSFDYNAVMTEKVINRIIMVYLDDFFKDVDMEWKIGTNVRTAIGQGDNAFTPVQVARYIAALTNGKTVYNLTAISGIKDNKETGAYIQNLPEVYSTLDIKEQHLQLIREGMLNVADGTQGTARNYFEECEVQVAAKTGTAQDNAGEISWFVGFAPYEKPEIALVTSMYGTDGVGSYNTKLARDAVEIAMKVNKSSDKVTLGSQFVP